MHYHTAYRLAVKKVCDRLRFLKRVESFWWTKAAVAENPVLKKLKHSTQTATDLGYRTTLEVKDGELHVVYLEKFSLSELNSID